MDKTEILYDHYKESCGLSQFAQKQRNKYFCGICILEIVNLVFLLCPLELSTAIEGWLDAQYSIAFSSVIPVLQGTIWALILYYTILYFQRNLYVERQYRYLAVLENQISKATDVSCFTREGASYGEDYPTILTLIDIFYKWGIPILIVVINTVKIIFEYMHNVSWFITIFDSLCFLFVVVLVASYLRAMNFTKHAE